MAKKTVKKPKKVVVKPTKQRQSKATRTVIAKKAVGDRPPSKGSLVDKFNWYNTMFEDQSVAYDAVMQYLAMKGLNETIRVVKANKTELTKKLTSTDWALASLLNDHQLVPDDYVKRWHLRLKDKIKAVCASRSAFVPQVKQKTFTKIVNEKLGDIEHEIDEVFIELTKNKRVKFSYSGLYTKYKITPEIQLQIASFYKPVYQDLVSGYKNDVEGYNNIPKPVLKAMIEVLRVVITYKHQQQTEIKPKKANNVSTNVSNFR